MEVIQIPKNCPIGKLAPDACFECCCNFGNACTYQSPEEKQLEREQTRNYFKNKFIEDLGLILKNNFDSVSVEKIDKIAEDLIEKGWIRSVSDD